ncbi:MAG: P22 coat protein - protein 5 domain protein [Ruminococcaceae bacterium]|nr:P22 coat protein - protein 5 domain protein [Oscillospiraceae bacterium]
MSVQNFIPTVWSETLQKALDEKYVGVANCSREYEGEIKKKGSRVKILNVGDISVSDYTPNCDMSSPESLDGTTLELVVDRAKYFNFQLDDIDHAQAVPGLMEAAMKNAAAALAKEADQYIYSLYDQVENRVYCDIINNDYSSILHPFLEARTMLMKSGVTDVNDIVFEITPKAAEELLKKEISLSSDSADIFENGCIGKIAGCKVFVTNNIYIHEGASANHHYCYARSRRAIAFAEQISEIEAYRPESRFADAVKGLHLYGAKIVYPNEICVLDLSIE